MCTSLRNQPYVYGFHFWHMTQFQIEGGGVVQDVNKLFWLFQILWPKTKIMTIKFTKTGVDSSFLGSELFFTKGWKKNQICYKRAFFSFFLFTKKTLKCCDFFFFFFKRCLKPKIKDDLYWLLVGKFFGPYQYTKFSLINYVR